MEARGITYNQLRALNMILNGIASGREERIGLLQEMTGRGLSSSRELTFAEAALLIDRLGGRRMRELSARKLQLKRTIYALSMQIAWLNRDYAGTDTDTRLMNMANVDRWLLTHGTVKKRVCEMTSAELGRTVGQMKSVIRRMERGRVGRTGDDF